MNQGEHLSSPPPEGKNVVKGKNNINKKLCMKGYGPYRVKLFHNL